MQEGGETIRIGKKENIEYILDEVVKIIGKYLNENDYKVYLFGSWAKGDALYTSDIDIGIYGDKKLDIETLVRIKEEVETLPSLQSIEIIDLKNVSADFMKNISKHWERLNE